MPLQSLICCYGSQLARPMTDKKPKGKKRATPKRKAPAKALGKKVPPKENEAPSPEPKPFTRVHRAPPANPMILTDLSGKKIAIVVKPDGSFAVGREGQSAPKQEPAASSSIVLKGLSGRKIVIAIKPDGSTVIGREGAPVEIPKGPSEKVTLPEKTTPESVGVVLEGTIGEERTEENPFGDKIKPEDVNPNVKHLDPRLLQPMAMRIEREEKHDETTSPDNPEPPAKRRNKEQ